MNEFDTSGDSGETHDSAAGAFFGPKPKFGDRFIEIISDPDSIRDDEDLTTVSIHPYIDPETNMLRKQLCVGVSNYDHKEGLSHEMGARQIEADEYIKREKDSIHNTITFPLSISGSDLTVDVQVTRVSPDEVIVKAHLLENDHNIDPCGPAYYLISQDKIWREYQRPWRSYETLYVEGIHFPAFGKPMAVDLINLPGEKHEPQAYKGSRPTLSLDEYWSKQQPLQDSFHNKMSIFRHYVVLLGKPSMVTGDDIAAFRRIVDDYQTSIDTRRVHISPDSRDIFKEILSDCDHALKKFEEWGFGQDPE